MPKLDDTIILEIVKTALSGGYSYSGLTGLDDTRAHKSQLFIYYRYETLQDGTAVSDVTWKNWYDPFVVPVNLISVDQTILQISIGDITGSPVVAENGTTYNMPTLDFSNGATLHIQRSQDVDNRAVDFGAGSRVTSDGLNAAIGQVFGSVQELADRITALEGFNFEVPVDNGGGGGGGNLTGGDKVEIFVSGVDLDTWTINAGVIDENNLDATLAALINSKVDAAGAAAAAPVQDIQPGSNVTVTDDGSGVFTISSTGGGGPGTPPELTQELTSTENLGGITAGDTFAPGTTLESMWRDLLITYQPPSLNFGNALSGTAEHGLTTYSISSLSCTKSNPDNINTAIPGAVNFNDPNNINDQNRSVTWNTSASQTVSFATISGTYIVSSGSPGATGQPLSRSYSISASGTNSEGGGFSDSDSINVYFRTYFGASPTIFTGANGSSILGDLSQSALDNNSKRTWTCTADNNDPANWTYFVMPQCHFDGITKVTQDGSLLVYSGFTNLGNQIISGVTYTFFKSNAQQAFNAGVELETS